ncbi:MAG: acyltransferase [Oscillospiraceae bacterium]|nr:acyltransferase [Oscillospiraceae bacterium]
MSSVKNIGFGREDTRAVKGIAVIMMLLHHLAGFGDRYPVGFEGFQPKESWFIKEGILSGLAFNMRFCVAIFFFLGGYGTYKSIAKGSFCLTNSVLGLFKKYWKVFFIFVPVAYLFFSRSGDGVSGLATRYNFSGAKELITTIISNFTMLSDSINLEWWFMKTYICVLLLGTVYCKLTKKLNSFAGELLLIFVIDMLLRSVLPNLPSVEGLGGLSGNVFFTRFCSQTASSSPFFAGIVFAKYDVVVRLKKILYQMPFRAVFGLAGAVAIIWCRCFITGTELDLIYTPLLAASLSVFFDSVKPLRRVFDLIGKHSTNIWLVHSFYCYYFLEATKLVYCTSNVWVDLGILVVMSFLTSVILELFYKYLFQGIEFMRSKFQKKDSDNSGNSDKPETETEKIPESESENENGKILVH